MEHVRFGQTGLLVSRLCLGTATFGVQCDEATSHEILSRAADLGITFVDTADKYPLGGSVETAGITEEIVGRWLRGRRDDVVIATKFHGQTGPNPWDRGSSRKHIVSAVEASLRRLGTDYIDIYQAHRPDPLTPIDETLSVLDGLVAAGKVRYLGCSNFLAYQVARALGRSEALGLARFDSVQPCYNLVFRQFERELFPLCREEGLAVLPYNALAGGLLTGKHNPSAPPADGTRFRLGSAAEMYQERYWHQSKFDVAREVERLAAEAGLRPTTLAVAWVLSNDVVTAPILGASRAEQLTDTVAAADVALDPGLVAQLNELTAGFRKGDAVE